ncbi:hypothetical protein DESUT3_00680 [Desulfuromonas versatilis]|uniref:PEGA domain-containing protein n=1 Tax=Desulfuromonas versatilis TaxID=2802975 RepID=A0ABN6DRZ3_9BACT|nr:PEGA domain-containing protein [Desulfuromonas versatilis]BCR02999.1 hypothetical protein DESUT3_00680 [Desulfuromonas versatilis]
MVKKAISVLLLLFFTSACAHQAAFVTDPPGAEVFVDGQAIGVTPCTYSYQNNTGGQYAVTIEKAGYESVRHKVRADEVDAPARKKWLAAGLVWSPLWLGTLFTKKLKESYEFALKRSAPRMTASAVEVEADRF